MYDIERLIISFFGSMENFNKSFEINEGDLYETENGNIYMVMRIVRDKSFNKNTFYGYFQTSTSDPDFVNELISKFLIIIDKMVVLKRLTKIEDEYGCIERDYRYDLCHELMKSIDKKEMKYVPEARKLLSII